MINPFSSYQKIIQVDNDKNKNKYLTKKLLLSGNELYYCGENGNLFYYNCNSTKHELIRLSQHSQLIGSPVLINNSIYVVDNKGVFYQIDKII